MEGLNLVVSFGLTLCFLYVSGQNVPANTKGSCMSVMKRKFIEKVTRSYMCYKNENQPCPAIRTLVRRGRWCVWVYKSTGTCVIRVQQTCKRTDEVCRYRDVPEYNCCNGYEHDGKNACRLINECQDNNGGCEQKCAPNPSCKGVGCERRICSCEMGYSSKGTECDDINECDTNNGGCEHNCHNTNGTYYCSCRTGYSLAMDGHNCTEIDECSMFNGGCEHYCKNTPGSFVCSCQNGFSMSQGYMCDDINECPLDHCSHGCMNFPGGYDCTCPSGYKFEQGSKHNCEDINECESNRGGCSHRCSNHLGGYECLCPEGQSLLNGSRTDCGMMAGYTGSGTAVTSISALCITMWAAAMALTAK